MSNKERAAERRQLEFTAGRLHIRLQYDGSTLTGSTMWREGDQRDEGTGGFELNRDEVVELRRVLKEHARPNSYRRPAELPAVYECCGVPISIGHAGSCPER